MYMPCNLKKNTRRCNILVTTREGVARLRREESVGENLAHPPDTPHDISGQRGANQPDGAQ